MDADWRNAFGILMCNETCNGAGAGICVARHRLALVNKRHKDCLWKQRTHYRLENGSVGFIDTFHKV